MFKTASVRLEFMAQLVFDCTGELEVISNVCNLMIFISVN